MSGIPMGNSSLRIVIVEDEAAHAEAIRRAFEEAGMDSDISVAGTLKEYRESIAERPPDVALLDLNLPDGRAVEVLKSPPEDGPFPILIMTSFGNEQVAVEALKSGALDYVVKSPEAFVAMPRTVTRVLREWNLLQERKRAEEDLQNTVEELRRSNRELEQFAYVASHDLQEPLRMVASNVQLIGIRYRGKLDEKADQYIDHAVEGAKRMQQLIEALLAFSRIACGTNFKPVDVNKVLAAAIDNLAVAIQESDAAITSDPLPIVSGDEVQLLQLFQNLLGNAIKYRRPEAPPRVHVGVVRKGSQWLFSIKDNGIGIEPQFFGKIFLIFQRLHTRKQYPGIGIGLAACKKIVECHNGNIWVESTPGEGTTFFFTIPLWD